MSNQNLELLLAEAASLPNSAAHGRAFERIASFALQNGPSYGAQIATVQRFEDWARANRPDLKGTARLDNGVDLVVTTVDGDMWAVQCKGYAKGARATVGDLSQFVASAKLVSPTKLLWVTSGAGLNTRAADQNAAAGHNVVVLNREWLAREVDYPDSLAALRGDRRETPQPYALREHQTRALHDVVAGLGAHDAVQFISACGTGKTVTTHAIHDKLGSQLTFFFVPRLGLMRQTIDSWRRQSGGEAVEMFAVCSDDSVAGRKRDEDELLVTDNEIPVRVIHSADQLSEAVAATVGRRVVLFCTYQSEKILAEAQADLGLPVADLLIADEAHMIVGAKKSLGKLVKDQGGIRATKRVYATATPRVVAPHLVHEAGFDSMDENSELYGPRAHEYTFGQAIAEGVLSPFRLEVIVVPEQDYVRYIEENNQVKGADTRIRELVAAHAIKKSMAAGNTQWITYHSRIRDAESFAELLHDEGVGSFAQTIKGSQTAMQREDIVDAFGLYDGGAVLTNVQCLNEGVDIPSLNGVAFISPKSKVADITQSIGRVLRRHEGKKFGVVQVPIPISEADFADGKTIAEISEMIATDKRWKTLLNVVEAMSEHMTVLKDEMTVIVQNGTTEGMDRHIGDSLDGGENIVIDASAISAAVRDRIVQGMRVAVHRRVAGGWKAMVGSLHAFVTDNARFPVLSKRSDRHERRLASWTTTHRRRYLEETLSESARRDLEGIRGWHNYLRAYGHRDFQGWMETAVELAEFMHLYGRAPRQQVADPEEKRLGAWLALQKINLLRKRLFPDRAAHLDKMNPMWREDRNSRWESMCTSLEQFVATNGRLPRIQVRNASSEDDQSEDSLGTWLSHQRKGWGNLPPELKKLRTDRLDAMHTLWRGDRDRRWLERLDEIVAFKRSAGRLPRHPGESTQESNLAQWIQSQKKAMRQGLSSFTSERRSALDERVPDWLQDRDVIWHDKLERTVAFVRTTEAWPRAGASAEGEEAELGAWLSTQKSALRSGRTDLTPDRTRKLNTKLPGWNSRRPAGRGGNRIIC